MEMINVYFFEVSEQRPPNTMHTNEKDEAALAKE